MFTEDYFQPLFENLIIACNIIIVREEEKGMDEAPARKDPKR